MKATKSKMKMHKTKSKTKQKTVLNTVDSIHLFSFNITFLHIC